MSDVEFPVKHDIEYVGGVRMERVGNGWRCSHDRVFSVFSAASAAEGCSRLCEAQAYDLHDPKGPRYHSLHADLWDQREGK